MAGRYLHVESLSAQLSRHAGAVCGDTSVCFREAGGTTLLLADGLGHGIRAHVAATLCVSRLESLLRGGYSVRQAVASVAATMEQVRGTDEPYAVFAVWRMLNSGEATFIGYEVPGAILMGTRHAVVLPTRPVTLGTVTVMEGNCHLAPGEGILLVSDGVTQAGIGQGLREGWTLDGVARNVDQYLTDARPLADLPAFLLGQVERLCGDKPGDDATVLMAACRWGRTLTILSGPPADRLRDGPVVNHFLRQEGWKVVCGGTTAQIVALHMGLPLTAVAGPQSLLAPPRQCIEGIDLVTEGAVTLNQVTNVLDVDPARFDEVNAVTDFVELLRAADRVTMIVGKSANPSSVHIAFRQQGILTRESIIPLLVTKLESIGKLVVVEMV